MSRGTPRIFNALAVLVALWIGVYWWWEPRGAGVTYDTNAIAPEVSAMEPETILPAPPPPAPRVIRPEPERPPTEPAAGQGASSLGEALASGVIPPRFRDYTVQSGDTFERIARRELGSIRFASAIASSNPMKDPRRLREGEVIRLPLDPSNIQGQPVEEPEAANNEPETREPVEYVVGSGDTLSGISMNYYGSSRYVDLIYRANRDRMSSPDDLSVGQTLVLPPPPAEEDN